MQVTESNEFANATGSTGNAVSDTPADTVRLVRDRVGTALDGRSLAIGVLTITACILFVALMLVPSTPPAQAIGMNDRSGDYILVTMQLTTSNEGVVLTDAAAKRMLVYSFDYNRKQLVPLSGYDLETLQQAVEPAGR